MKKTFFLIFGELLMNSLFCSSFDAKPFSFNPRILDKNSIVNCSSMNIPLENENQRIILSNDGHLFSNNKRIRIYGTNLSTIPSKKDATFWAETLASQGFNCVRFHHYDADWTNCFLRYDSTGKYSYNWEKIDDFDYFYNELKRVGIYTNMNLLTGRNPKSPNGMPKELDFLGWKERHALGFWNENALENQKEYARTILTHKNPYTNSSLAQDYATAIIEINNENGLLASYYNGYLDLYPKNVMQEMEDKWNDFLTKNDYSFKTLQDEFNQSIQKGEKIISYNSKPNLERHEGASATLLQLNDTTTIKVNSNGKEGWHVQLCYNSGKIQKDKIYTLSFKAKASKSCEISLSLMNNHEPWHSIGLQKNLKLDTKYQDFEFVFAANSDDEKSRVAFSNMGFLKGTNIDIKNISFYEGGKIENVKKGSKHNSVAFPTFNEYRDFPSLYKKIVTNFLYEIENEYWEEMRSFIKEELNAKPLLMGTICGCSTQGLMNKFDIIDSHAYWHHPIFHGSSWDNANYSVQNENMATSKTGGVLSSLAIQRIYGKPFSVTEYDFPYPNQFSSQMMPMIASYASFQDWDCLFNFAYEFSAKDSKKAKINGYFDQANTPSKVSSNFIAARIFREFLVQPANHKIFVEIDKKTELERLPSLISAWNFSDAKMIGIPLEVALVHQVGVNYFDSKNELKTNLVQNEIFEIKNKIENGQDLLTDTNEILWNSKNGDFIVNSKKAFVNVSQLPKQNDLFSNDLLKIQFTPKDDFCVVSGVEVQKNHYAIFSCSWSGNQNEKLRKYGEKPNKNNFNIIRENVPLTSDVFWNIKKPAVALASEGILSIKSNRQVKLFTLTTDGTRKNQVNCLNNNLEKTDFLMERNCGSLWYELILE